MGHVASRRANVILLVLAYGTAQGAMLLSQTGLVLFGAWELIGHFGLAFTFATLAYLLVDWGGAVLLARIELSDADEDEAAAFFWNLSLVRIAVASAAVGSLGIWVATAPRDFTSSYVIAAAPALLLGAVNPAGFLDGLQRSGVTGLTSIAPTLLSALALPAALFLPAAARPYLLGGAFTAGTALSLALQYGSIARAGRALPFHRPTLEGMKIAAREGALIMVNPLPSWLFARAEVAISMSVLGAAATGMFVYAKQVANAAQQLTYLIRRAELPALMACLGESSIRSALYAQRISIVAGGAVGLAMTALGLALARIAPLSVAAPMLIVAAFGPVVVVASFYAAINQMYIVQGRTFTATLVGCAFIPAFFVAVPAVKVLGVYGLAAIEMVVNSVALCLLILMRASASGHSPLGATKSV